MSLLWAMTEYRNTLVYRLFLQYLADTRSFGIFLLFYDKQAPTSFVMHIFGFSTETNN